MLEREPPPAGAHDDLVAEHGTGERRRELLDVGAAEPAREHVDGVVRLVDLGRAAAGRPRLEPPPAQAYGRRMAVKLHRCPNHWVKLKGHPCWKVEKALIDEGIPFELVPGPLRRGKRDALEALSGQRQYPVIVLEDGTVTASSRRTWRSASGTVA